MHFIHKLLFIYFKCLFNICLFIYVCKYNPYTVGHLDTQFQEEYSLVVEIHILKQNCCMHHGPYQVFILVLGELSENTCLNSVHQQKSFTSDTFM